MTFHSFGFWVFDFFSVTTAVSPCSRGLPLGIGDLEYHRGPQRLVRLQWLVQVWANRFMTDAGQQSDSEVETPPATQSASVRQRRVVMLLMVMVGTQASGDPVQ